MLTCFTIYSASTYLRLDFQGARVLVTAGTKGVGKAVVGVLKQRGARVLTTARHAPAECSADIFVAADLTTAEGCASVAQAVQAQMGGVDAIIHVVGGNEWQIAQLARHAAMSRSAFFAAFNETVGMPPGQYLLFWRMSLAKKALVSSKEKIEQIAFHIGYQSASAFNVAFTQYVGVPPGVFRRQNEAAQTHTPALNEARALP
ncbi:SDR family NAD(P)-dependent oxidoreductase [Kosakonia oryziphila]|uniref:AraC-type DNA-binding protein n=1 Tax=Kosakonia oryziphila TaxID=1005667 RepID=A0A1C4GC37_9ENTR|nr:SDR family NAD(P)-dependent oxidoreductase [Kosakonia oryziphila]SCC65321.1 AraC-type DNA-binding protein [Kosakonia oryziphila]